MSAAEPSIDPFQVLSSERGVVRVFTTELDAEGSSAVTVANVQRLLGNDLDLDDSRIEVFPSTALEAMGLSIYLQEGYGIPEEDLRGVAAALDSLKGLIVLVVSGAFKGQSVSLEPNPGLRFVGLVREPSMAPPEIMSAPSSTEGVLGDKQAEVQKEPPRGTAWPIAILVLIAALTLVLLLVF